MVIQKKQKNPPSYKERGLLCCAEFFKASPKIRMTYCPPRTGHTVAALALVFQPTAPSIKLI